MQQPELKIYHRLPGETARAYEMFCMYRDMGVKRKIQAVIRKKSGSKQAKSNTSCSVWAKKYKWAERAAAYDADLLEKTMNAAADKTAELHAQQFAEMKNVVLTSLLRRIQFEEYEETTTRREKGKTPQGDVNKVSVVAAKKKLIPSDRLILAAMNNLWDWRNQGEGQPDGENEPRSFITIINPTTNVPDNPNANTMGDTTKQRKAQGNSSRKAGR